VDPVPDLLLIRSSGRAGNRTRNSGSVDRNSGYKTTILHIMLHIYSLLDSVVIHVQLPHDLNDHHNVPM
jgi:hypothetical protein